jgi:hypothetical protein
MSDFMNVNWDHFHSNPSSETNTMGAMKHSSPNKDCDAWSSGSPPKRQRRRQRRVQFEEQLVSSIVVTEGNPAPPDVIWYSPKEFQATTKALQVMIREARRRNVGLFRSPNDHQFRGLEDLLSTQATLNRRKRLRSVLEVVLEEQARQTSVKQKDPILLGKQVTQVSQSSLKQALMRGSLDAMAAYPFGVSSSYYRR